MVSNQEQKIAPDSSEESRLLLTECQQDPLFFAREVLGITLTEDQEMVMLGVRDHRRVAVRSGNGEGKTVVMAACVLWFGFSFQPCVIVTTATVGRQVKAQLWGWIPRLYYGAKYALGGEMREKSATWQIGLDSKVVGFSTDHEDKFQGWHAPHVLFVLDEASGLSQTVFTGMEGSMTGGHSRVIAGGNPLRPEGPFYNCFSAPGWTCLKMDASRHPNIIAGEEVMPGAITQGWMDGRRDEWGPDSPWYIARVLGDFPESVADALIPRPWAMGSLERGRGIIPPLDRESLRYGVDVARFGADYTVHLIRDKHAVRYMEVYNGRDLMHTCGRVQVLAKEWGIPEEAIAIDDTGMGGGVTDKLHEDNLGVTPIDFGRRAMDSEHFANLRAELHWHMRNALDPAKGATFAVPPEYEVLCAEMVQSHYSFTSAAQIKIEPKDAIKKRLGRSPDHADALALTFAPLAPSMRIERL